MSRQELFDVHRPPPTEEEIKRQLLRHFCAIGGITLLPALGLALLPIWVETRSLSAFYWVDLAAAIALPLFVLAFQSEQYEEVLPKDCHDLLNICNRTPEGQQYRHGVLAQGRKFRNGEMAMLEVWNHGIGERAACRALYDQAPPEAPAEVSADESANPEAAASCERKES